MQTQAAQPQRRHHGRVGVGATPVDPSGQLIQPSVLNAAPLAVVAPRTRRDRHLPARYRGQADEGEEISIHDHSDVLDDSVENTATPNALAADNPTSGHGPQARGSPTITGPSATDRPVDPLATNVSSTSNKAFNIEYFFRKETEDTICTVCERIATEFAAQGSAYNVQYHFSPKTSNTPLHHHIEVRHAFLYLEQVEKNGWAIRAKFTKSAFTSGYTFKTLKHVLSQVGVKLDALPPPPPPDPLDRLPLGVIQPQKSKFGASLPPFTVDGLKDHMVHYLVANDLSYASFFSIVVLGTPQILISLIAQKHAS
ncbi:hypothetical protein JVT61DRAFT_4616 [Boletus reticuloceps]|uniref:Uncharacterized protein n=1 Tax=Boletus reticuloceps TaxID=495285 RepID=A0A8I2YKG3_9AGAM|nr:hypothetical protein JVT61DRAFT_4616 [Boletus reticuloceps]